ncbi:FHA domain-containing protein [Corallococcus sp. M34]|uniref:sigma-54-dependent Fis family transcriptional regulator n=1 Tax=Citreicoccus inhibens TaxID=2849499 RepID=UPI001C24F8FD|nr:FHA domain-containing protein [Citreicoccus inhibens]MBU8897379.1 FHA domain-containing protein [Citreicoccus inhibens]
MPALLLLTGPSAGRRFELTPQVTIGRSPSCEIPLEDEQASRRHALLTLSAGQARIRDLGSRNGTLVNGQRIDAEVLLVPGDQVRVGTTLAVFEPPPVSIVDESVTARPSVPPTHVPIEEVLPHVGTAAALYSAGTALLGATSTAMVLRRLAEEVSHALNADRAAALLGGGPEGLRTGAAAGAATVDVPSAMAQASLEGKELVQQGTSLCAPLVASGGMPSGVVYVERAEPDFTDGEGQLLAALGRMGGEALAAVRSRTDGDEADAWPTPVGTSRPWRALLEEARRAAASAAPVVVAGEPGVGKAVLARFVHARSPRALGPLVTVDCRGAFEQVEAALFGRASEPGHPPLTSAVLRADGGSLLLLHVDALPSPLAERLAGMLARRSAPARQGGEEPVDVRVLATAVVPLARSGGSATLARVLVGFEMSVPPLRERSADAPVLFEHFAARAARQVRQMAPLLTAEARCLLVDYAWPHNVREVELLAERLGRVHAGSPVGMAQLPVELQLGGAPRTLAERVARLERDAIAEALREAGGMKARAAELLGIGRPTLDRKLAEHTLLVPRGRGE